MLNIIGNVLFLGALLHVVYWILFFNTCLLTYPSCILHIFFGTFWKSGENRRKKISSSSCFTVYMLSELCSNHFSCCFECWIVNGNFLKDLYSKVGLQFISTSHVVHSIGNSNDFKNDKFAMGLIPSMIFFSRKNGFAAFNLRQNNDTALICKSLHGRIYSIYV